MERTFYGLLMALAILFTPWPAVAHPGHGHDDGLSLKHYLVNYAHLVPVLLIAGIVFAILSHLIRTTRSMKPK